MPLYLLLAKDCQNTDGMPGDWPRTSQVCDSDPSTEGTKWTLCLTTIDEYKAPHQAEHDAWLASQGPTQQQIWEQQLRGIYTDSVTGISLRKDLEAVTWFTSLASMITLALVAGAVTGETPETIWDANGQPQTITVTQLTGLLLRYGAAIKDMFAKYKP